MIDKFELGMIVTVSLGDKRVTGKVTQVPEDDPTVGWIFPQGKWVNVFQVVGVAGQE